MAYIVDARELVSQKLSGDETLSLDQRATVLKLARAGHEQCAVAWRDYADLDPADAAAVVKHLDGTLTKAGASMHQSDPEAERRAMLAGWADDPDPSLRSSARNALAALDGAA